MFRSHADVMGWSESTQVSFLLDYIAELKNTNSFEHYLHENSFYERSNRYRKHNPLAISSSDSNQLVYDFIEEIGTGRTFAIEKSSDDDGRLYSPYGNGLLLFK